MTKYKRPLKWELALGILIIACSMAKPATAQTQGDIIFLPDQSPERPVDPIDPTKPIKPVHPPSEGPYSITYISDLEFGSQKVPKDNATFYAHLDEPQYEDGSKKKSPNFIQVSDKSGSQSGWKLSVSQEQPLTNQDGFELKNTIISLKNSRISTSFEQAKPFQMSTEEIAITSDGTSTLIAQAKASTGQGTWSIQFGADNQEAAESVTLYIPKDTPKKAGKYKTQLRWNFENSL